MSEPFPLTPIAMLREGVAGFRREPVLLLAGGVLTFAILAATQIPAQMLLDDGRQVAAIVVHLLGAVLAGTAAYPWFTYALDAARQEPGSFAKPFQAPDRFFAQFVAAFWFWAAVLLGARYLAGLPAILATVFYAFYGYVIVDKKTYGGMRALGTSVRLGDKRRIALFAILALFAVFNFMAAVPLGFGLNPLSVVAATALLLVSTSITMVAGAALYDTLKVNLPDG
ncbi:MAG: hypothetical protein AAF531_18185 [Actinomycetota bacterium]